MEILKGLGKVALGIACITCEPVAVGTEVAAKGVGEILR
jgi:hypothetical protein